MNDTESVPMENTQDETVGKRNLKTFCAGAALNDIGEEMYAPFLPYFAATFGTSATHLLGITSLLKSMGSSAFSPLLALPLWFSLREGIGRWFHYEEGYGAWNLIKNYAAILKLSDCTIPLLSNFKIPTS